LAKLEQLKIPVFVLSAKTLEDVLGISAPLPDGGA